MPLVFEKTQFLVNCRFESGYPAEYRTRGVHSPSRWADYRTRGVVVAEEVEPPR